MNHSPDKAADQTEAAGPSSTLSTEQVLPTDPTLAHKQTAIAALVVGVLAFFVGFVPVLGIVIGIAGIALAVLALLKKQRKRFAWAGLVLATCALITSCITTSGLSSTGERSPTVPAMNEASQASREVSESANKPGVTEDRTEAPAPKEPAAAPPVPAPVPEPKPVGVPVEFGSALKKAESYGKTMHMSKAGIYNQLTSEFGEKFSAEAAQYAIDNVKMDWSKNALEKAKDYQRTMAMAPEAIRDQLVSEFGEHFTPEEADYAVEHLPK